MNNVLSQRFREAIDFLKRNGSFKTDGELAGIMKVAMATISMATTGMRPPSWELLLKFCDLYPISFDWLRTGRGKMVKGDYELSLLKRIEELERKIKALENQA